MTIGEAIDLTQARENEQRRGAAESNSPLGPADLARQRWDNLTSDRDRILDAQSRLRATYGEGAQNRSEWAGLENSLSRLDRQLTTLKPVVFAD
jgi:hypothetical protein